MHFRAFCPLNNLRRRLTHVWEATQVELQGYYSLQRFEELLAHAKTSSATKNLATIMLAPLPALLALLFIDTLPLNPPEAGFMHQTSALYIRIWATAFTGSMIFTRGIHLSTPALPLSPGRLLIMAMVPATATTLAFAALGKYWVFPTPFGFQLAVFPGIIIAMLMSWYSWKSVLTNDSKAKVRARCYTQALAAQANLFPAYLAYSTAFTLAGGKYQQVVALSLPVLKVLFKNLFRKGLYYVEDLSPVAIACSIDAFHAMFVATTIQQGGGPTTILFVAVVDIVQLLVSYNEIFALVRDVKRIADDNNLAAVDGFSSGSKRCRAPCDHSRLIPTLQFNPSIVHFCLFVIETNPRIRDHPRVALPCFLREQKATPIQLSDARVSQILPQGQLNITSNRGREVVTLTDPLTDDERAQLQIISSTFKLLHMIEFYVLIEYMEVAVAAIYTLYVMGMAHMPNRVYYKQFIALDREELDITIVQLALYTSFEAVSLVLFCMTTNLHLQHVSSLQQLAFVVQKEWKIVVPTLALWAVLVVMFNFGHVGTYPLDALPPKRSPTIGPLCRLGMDFTFQFEWVRGSHHDGM